jgi:hypothetical protein
MNKRLVHDAKDRSGKRLRKCLQSSPSPTLKELLLSDDARVEIPLPARGGAQRRAPALTKRR